MKDQTRTDAHTVDSFASYATNTEQSIDVEHHLDVIVAGSLAMDLCCDYNPIIAAENVPILETSNPASISQSLGGVGHNIATALHYVGTRVRLCAPIGDDLAGRTAFRNLKSRGLDTTGLRTIHGSGATPQYVAVNDKLKNMFVAMADMRLLEGSADMVDQFWPSELVNSRPKWLVVDANWSTELVGRWIQAGRAVGSKIALEPVSVEKSSRMFCKTWKDHMQRYLKSRTESTEYLADLVSPNRAELKAMAQQIRPENAWSALLTNLASPLDDLLSVHVANFEDVASDATKLLSDFGCIVTKLGSEGVLLAELLFEGDSRLEDVNQDRYIVFRKADLSSHKNGANLLPPIDPDSSISTIAGIYIRHYPPAKKVAAQDVINVNGVGDTFLGVLIAASLKKSDAHISELINIAQQSAILTLQDSAAVSPKIKTLLI